MIKHLMRLAPLALVLVVPLAASAQSAKSMPSCAKGDPVVWVNQSSHVYHMKGDQYYGTTKSGQYMCQSKADASGAHASKSASKGGAMMSDGAMSGMHVSTTPTPSAKSKKMKGDAAATPAP